MNNKKLLTGALLLSGIFVLASCGGSSKTDFTLSFSGEKCYAKIDADTYESNFTKGIKKNETIGFQIVPEYEHEPANLKVKIGGKDAKDGVDYIYNRSTHAIKIDKVKGDVEIAAVSAKPADADWTTYKLEIPVDNFTYGTGYYAQFFEDGHIAWGDHDVERIPQNEEIPLEAYHVTHTYKRKGTYYVSFHKMLEFGSITKGVGYHKDINKYVTEVEFGTYLNKGAECPGTSNKVLTPSDSAAECVNLTKVTFDEGLELDAIGNGSFKNTKIEEIVVPSTVWQIQNAVFAGCSSLKIIDLSATSGKVTAYEPTTQWAHTLPQGSDDHLEHIYVPADQVNAYQNDNVWNEGGTKHQAIITAKPSF